MEIADYVIKNWAYILINRVRNVKSNVEKDTCLQIVYQKNTEQQKQLNVMIIILQIMMVAHRIARQKMVLNVQTHQALFKIRQVSLSAQQLMMDQLLSQNQNHNFLTYKTNIKFKE
ncbi:hypothetical protein TTHERM_000895969 (macronuclear) [Tetrahymena thermophila SB210]|uniref:Uncharacterized protein n=1 Tax=Tetrahymena thermophila (strain SB210) TaxID=312017 RepID=W7XCY6_TETTS|nr:hypothetical protein TTHERM_000895969 [Tetrahymena thermophila SB210]EWS75322.1 hypothetical protein TTHERM_000895969 [Tetrahymena thermophila SB210]|eukprot:XP_012652154.1 hypothetical protein TTHERM_000895969 [Tetrahymena thermophila SB210]